MKYLITLGLIYLAYRYFFARPAIPAGMGRQETPPQKTKKQEGEYIDYEEVD
jgi:hypothetical protein